MALFRALKALAPKCKACGSVTLGSSECYIRLESCPRGEASLKYEFDMNDRFLRRVIRLSTTIGDILDLIKIYYSAQNSLQTWENFSRVIDLASEP
jgi:hypothetical protein